MVCTWQCGSGMMAIHVSELKLSSLSSRNTLGDTSHNSNKLKQNWVKLGWRKCMVGKPMRKWWWWLMKKQPSLSIRNTLGDSSHYSNNLKCYVEQNGLGCGSRWWLCGCCGGSPRQICQNSQNFMESNDVVGIFVGRRMSTASKRAK